MPKEPGEALFQLDLAPVPRPAALQIALAPCPLPTQPCVRKGLHDRALSAWDYRLPQAGQRRMNRGASAFFVAEESGVDGACLNWRLELHFFREKQWKLKHEITTPRIR